MEVKCFNDPNFDKTSLISAIKDIFFATTSRKDFTTSEEKDEFFRHWTDFYFSQWADHCFYICGNGGRVLAYLTGCPDSKGALDFISVKSYRLFQDQFHQYPAHLHINTHPDSQGQGVGGRLIQHYLEFLRVNSVDGVHIVTSGQSRNIGFYRRLGFSCELERDFGGSRLRFMAQKIHCD